MTYFNATDKAIASFVYASVLVFGTSGNLIIIISILFRREARRKQSNIFIVSLSLTDFLTSTVCGPYYMRSLYVSEFISKEGTQSWLCSIVLVAVYYLSIESIISLALISLDRCFAVRMPFWYQRWVTRRFCVIAVCSSWAYSLVAVFPPILKSEWIVYQNHAGSPCGFEWEEADTAYIVVSFSISFFIPTIVICITNVLVFKTAKEQQRKIKALLPTGNIGSSKIPDSDFVSQNSEKPMKMAASTNENIERISIGSTGELPFVNECECTVPSYRALCSVSRKSVKVTTKSTTPDPEEHQVARKLSLKRIATLQMGDSIGLHILQQSKFSDGSRAQNNDLFLVNVTQTRVPDEFEEIEGNSTSLNRPKDKLYQGVDISPGMDSRRPKEGAGRTELKPPEVDKTEARRNSRTKISPRREMKLVLATISISIAFFISWMPFVLPRILLLAGVTSVAEKVMNYGAVFATMSSAWNPYIIVLTRKEILLGFKTVMKQLQEIFKK